MGYTLGPSSDDCYKGTYCLINKYGVRDEKLPAQVESKLTLAKISTLEEHPIEGSFDFEHYKAIHWFIFEELSAAVLEEIIGSPFRNIVFSAGVPGFGSACFVALLS